VKNLERGGRTRKSPTFLFAGNTLKSIRDIRKGTTEKLMRGQALSGASSEVGITPREGKAQEGLCFLSV